MTLCSNRPEGFGPQSHLYSHILTSCFLDTILVPLCTWVYLLVLVVLLVVGTRRASGSNGFRTSKASEGAEIDGLSTRRNKTHLTLSILYFLLLLAQILMCILEITRLSLAHLGIGLLPFTFITLILAGALRFTNGVRGRVYGWRWANLAVFVALIVTNGVKIAEETKEGTGQRKGSKYPESDEIIDVSVMIGVYAVLGLLEVLLKRGQLR
ncbi:hypothetical protein P7C71_g3417, partial [Lecanoromycetidae sp. Uapishka_2]